MFAPLVSLFEILRKMSRYEYALHDVRAKATLTGRQ